MPFMDEIRSMESEAASVREVFGGLSPVRARKNNPEWEQRVIEAAEFWADVLNGRRPVWQLQEALDTADFPLLFADALDRTLLGNYEALPPVWDKFFRKNTAIRDFRTVKRFYHDGADSALPEVVGQEEVRLAPITEGKYEYKVKVYGRRVALSWQVLVNDDLNAFADTFDRLALAARRTEQRFATQLYCDANGPHASVFTSGNNNIVPSNYALSHAAFQIALAKLRSQRDANGEPLYFDRVVLVVPPQLEATAYAIINATQVWSKTRGGGSPAQEILLGNVAKPMGLAEIVVDPYIPVVATTNGETSWFVFAEPTVSRPAGELGFLNGFAAPGLYRKTPNIERVGGGVDPRLGSWESRSHEYMVLHVFGGAIMDPKAVVGSNGTGGAVS